MYRNCNWLSTDLTYNHIFWAKSPNQIMFQNEIWLRFFRSKCLWSYRSQSQSIAHFFGQTFRKIIMFNVKLNEWKKLQEIQQFIHFSINCWIKIAENTSFFSFFMYFFNCKATKIELWDWYWNDRQSQSFCLSFKMIYRSKKPLILDVIVIVIGKLWLIS